MEISLIIGVIIALAELLKKVGINPKYIPIADLILGIAAGFVYLYPGDPKMAVLYGIIAGLSAAGLYSGIKNVSQGVSK
jgi:ABC-type amino acid transport system permease subunit